MGVSALILQKSKILHILPTLLHKFSFRGEFGYMLIDIMLNMYWLRPGHIPNKTSSRPVKGQKSVSIARLTCECRTLDFEVL